MLNQNIAALRKQKGYTQESLAQELNVVRQTISKWENGYSVPDAIMLEKLAELFEVPVSELLGDTDEGSGDKVDLKQISEQLSVLNNLYAKELARKKKIRKTALIALLVSLGMTVLLGLLCLISLERNEYAAGIEPGGVIARTIDDELDKAVSEAILTDNYYEGSMGECPTESHFVFGTEETGGDVKVYMLEKYTVFGFRDGFFTDVSGGSTPVVRTFQKTEDGYELILTENVEDGSYYAPSVKRLFPARYAKLILSGLPEEIEEMLWDDRARQARMYLDSINRDEMICRYGDIKTVFFSDLGIPAETENKILEMRLEYDYNIGSHEKIEDGKRYVYQTDYDDAKNLITFTKFEYGTNNITEYIAVDGATGETVNDAPVPEKIHYYKGILSHKASQ